MDQIVEHLPHVNAALNALATGLLMSGWVLVRRKRMIAHRNVMLLAFCVSVLFLIGYLTHRSFHPDRPFPREQFPTAAWVYYGILVPHVILAACVPALAIRTIYLGLTGRTESHRFWARITFPIWMFVSVTGVLIFLFLNIWFVAQ